MRSRPKLSSFIIRRSWVGLIAASLCALNSCNNPSEPAVPDSPDSTSHDFAWSSIEFAPNSSSILLDVAIINDTSIYAVGEIKRSDAQGNDINPPFNVAHWNGSTWAFICLYVSSPYSYDRGRAVFAFGPDDVWIGCSVPWHWDGANWKVFSGANGYAGAFQIQSIWGTSSTDLFIGGDNGQLQHFDGNSWVPILTGTTEPIADIWGANNPLLGGGIALMPASGMYSPTAKLLRLNPGRSIDTVTWPEPLGRPMQSVWFNGDSQIYICGAGAFVFGGSDWKQIPDIPEIYAHSIRGNDQHDIVIVGDYGLVGHYNGKTWRIYSELSLSTGAYYSVAIRGNLIVAVGRNGSLSAAKVLLGIRK